MTVRQLSLVLVRRWYVVLVGLLCTGLLMSWASDRQGVFTTQVDVVFLVPVTAEGANVLSDSRDTLITFANIVATQINADQTLTRFSSPSATLYGSGVRQGYSVRLPNSGGQWENYYTRPVLSVEVVGPSADEVRGELDRVLARINDVVADRQRSAGAKPLTWIHTELSPNSPVVSYVGGSPRRGAMAVGLLGLALTAIAALAVDRVLRARRRRASALLASAPAADPAPAPERSDAAV